MVGINKINEVAENMLLSHISKDSDFYEYIKNPAVMKVVLSELMKNADKHTNGASPDAVATINVDAIFSSRKSVYTKLMEHGVTERKVQNLSTHKSNLCKEGVDNVDKVILASLQQLLEKSSDKDNVDENIKLAKSISEKLSQLRQIDAQLISNYQVYVQQGELSRDVERGYKALFNEDSKNEYVAEYASQISTETLRNVPKHRRIRYVDRASIKNGEMHYRPNKRKTKLPVLAGIAILTACIGLGGVQNARYTAELEKKSSYLGVEHVYDMEDNEATMLANIMMLAGDEQGVRYNVPKHIVEKFREGDFSSDDFVNKAFKDLGEKIVFRKDVAKAVEVIAENFVKYKVCEAIKADIQRYGDDSHYKEYEEELSFENIVLEYVAPSEYEPFPGCSINLNEKTLFSNRRYGGKIPRDIEIIIKLLKEDLKVVYRGEKLKQEAVEGIFKSANKLRGLDLKISGDRLVETARANEKTHDGR